MNTTNHHLASLNIVTRPAQVTRLALKKSPELARRIYLRQMDFIAALYGVTTLQLEQTLRHRPQFV